MAFRISPKGKIKESPLPRINRKTFIKMESRVIVDNPLLMGIKAKRVLIKEI